jgi:hypothetical protein
MRALSTNVPTHLTGRLMQLCAFGLAITPLHGYYSMALPGPSEADGQPCTFPDSLFLKTVIMVGFAEFSNTKGQE